MNFTIGIVSMFLTLVLSALRPVIFKKAKFNIINSLFMSSIAMLLFSGIYLLYKWYKDPDYFTIDNKNKNIFNLTSNPFYNAVIPTIFFLSVLSQIRFATQYYSYSHLPISVTVPMTALTTFVVIGFAHYLNKQEITNKQLISAGIVFIGIIVLNLNKILGNSKEANSITHSTYIFCIIILLLSILLNGYLLTEYKDMVENVTPLQVMYNESFGAFCLMLLVMIIYIFTSSKTMKKFTGITKITPTLTETKNFFIAFFFIFNFAIVTRFVALKNLNVIVMAILLNLKVVLSLVFGKFFFNEEITTSKIIGATLIIMASIMITYYSKQHSEIHTKHPTHH